MNNHSLSLTGASDLLRSAAVRLIPTPDSSENPASAVRNLVALNPDHPGFSDPEYRRRRDEVARLALDHQMGDPVPRVEYTDREHAVWREVQAKLLPEHRAKVCRELLEAQERFPMDDTEVPQLSALNHRLAQATGFQMEPVMGLVEAATFLEHLGRRIFLSTQYVRHHSKPFYTPEPDIIHELIGHAASLAHPRIAEINRAFGQAAVRANEEELRRIERVYWYTMEFGVLEEGTSLKAYGAGLLSSVGELQRIEQGPALLLWDLETIGRTEYDPTRMQPHLFVAPSFGQMLEDLSRWLVLDGWRAPTRRSKAV